MLFQKNIYARKYFYVICLIFTKKQQLFDLIIVQFTD